MCFERVERPVVGVPRYRQQSGSQMPAVQAAVIRAEAVDHYLELRGHTVVIQRCSKYDHIGIQKCTADDLVVILLHTRSLIAAAHTSDARMHVHLTNVEHLDGVTVFFRSALEILN